MLLAPGEREHWEREERPETNLKKKKDRCQLLKTDMVTCFWQENFPKRGSQSVPKKTLMPVRCRCWDLVPEVSEAAYKIRYGRGDFALPHCPFQF